MNRTNLQIKPKNRCQYDLTSLGEVMLRFDPGDSRIQNARLFKVWEGGGEYNVARGLSKCFGQRTAIVSSLVDNEVGKLVRNLINEGGVDSSLIVWLEDDGIGKSARNGIYFLEKGFGIRQAKASSDRANTAVSKLKRGDIDWDNLFGNLGVRWFHTGGIFAGLSENSPEVLLEALECAKKHGSITSYDLNYRPSLWKNRGGKDAANNLNRKMLEKVDLLFGIESLSEKPESSDVDLFQNAILEMSARFPNLKVIATTKRTVKNASVNDWGGLLWMHGKFYQGKSYPELAIYDRVGGGDAFAAGLIHALLEDLSPDQAIQYAIIHGALTMTTPGDNSMVTKEEVESFINNDDSSVCR